MIYLDFTITSRFVTYFLSSVHSVLAGILEIIQYKFPSTAEIHVACTCVRAFSHSIQQATFSSSLLLYLYALRVTFSTIIHHLPKCTVDDNHRTHEIDNERGEKERESENERINCQQTRENGMEMERVRAREQ